MLVVGASVLMLAVRVFWLDSLLSNVSHLVLAVRVFGPSLAYSRARVGAFCLIDARGVSLLFIYLFDACLARLRYKLFFARCSRHESSSTFEEILFCLQPYF